jgi:hypothetical protein
MWKPEARSRKPEGPAAEGFAFRLAARAFGAGACTRRLRGPGNRKPEGPVAEGLVFRLAAHTFGARGPHLLAGRAWKPEAGRPPGGESFRLLASGFRLLACAFWLLASGFWLLGPAALAQSLAVRLDGDRLRVSAPNLRFLAGRPLERLKNGASVAFDVQLSLSIEGGRVRERAADRFGISYDLWEERFSVTSLGPSARSVSRLTPTAAEAWCLDHLALPAAGLPPARPFWIRLEVRAEDPRERLTAVGETGISLSRLIEIFSRPARDPQARWTEEAGPLRLADIQRINERREAIRPASRQ